MSKAIRVVDCTDSAFETLADSFAARDDDPITGRFGRRYFPATNLDAVDLSFIIIPKSNIRILVPCTAIANCLGWHGFPIRPVLEGNGLLEDQDVARALLDALVARMPRAEGGHALIRVPAAISANLTAFDRASLLCGAKCDTRVEAVVDLVQDELSIEQGLRRRYRAHVNRGRRELSLELIDSANPDRTLFDRYRELHALVAGRVTRPATSWEAMFDAIVAGDGALHLVSDKAGELLGSVYVALGKRGAYYASGAYIREAFDRPLSHWPQLASILDAKRRCLERYEIGHVPYTADVDKKNASIGFFKSGFTSTLLFERVWSIPMQGVRV